MAKKIKATDTDYLMVGEVAKRCGIETSAIRYYESKGLIVSTRTVGNQRRYHRSVIRRVAILLAAQEIGLNLSEITDAFSDLPGGDYIPTKRDWEKLSGKWRLKLDKKINKLEKLRDKVTGCIGCGCLSLDECALLNWGDHVNEKGSGPVLLNE